MTKVYVDEKGREYDVPDDPTPQEVAEIRQLKLKPKGVSHPIIKDVVKSLGSGAAEGLFRAPLILGDLNKLALTGINKVVPDTISQEDVDRYGSQGWIDAFRDSPQDKWLKENLGLELLHEPETTAGRYAKASSSAVAGATSMGALGAAPGIMGPTAKVLTSSKLALTPGAAAVNAASGAAGELGYDLSRGFDETKPGNPLAAIAAAVGTAGAGNAVRLARAPNLDQQIYNATQSMRKPEWRETERDLEMFSKSGSKTHTLADLPKLQPRIGGMAQDLSNTTGGDLLRQRLSIQARAANKDSDIPKLMQSVTEGIPAGQVDPREVARLLGEKGAKRISSVGPKTAAILSDSLVGGVAGKRDFSQIIEQLRRVPPEKLDRELYMLGLSNNEAMELSKALAQRLKPMPNVTKAPAIDRIDREIFDKVTEYAHPAVAGQVKDKLKVADSLARLTAEHGADRTLQMDLSKNWMQWMTPFSTTARRSGLRTSEKETVKLADLIGNPTKENLAELERLSRIDPRLKYKLQVLSSMVGAAESRGSDR